MQQWVDAKIKDLQYIQFLSYVPKILLAIIIPIFDDLYHKVAVWLNDMGELMNHKKSWNLWQDKVQEWFVNNFFDETNFQKIIELMTTMKTI